MKFILSIALAFAVYVTTYAQWTTSGANIRNSNSGNVGIGVSSPTEKLHINGNINFSGSGRRIIMGAGISGNTFGISFSTAYPNYGIFYTEGAPDYVSLSPNGIVNNGVVNIYGDNKVGIGKNNPSYTLDVNGPINATGLYINGTPFSGGGASQWASSGSNINYATGVVSIGTTTAPSGYKLAVGGKIVAEELVVKLQSNWPDYVFESGYDIPSLPELEEFIIKHKHLPGVPTAAEVKENGVSVGEMNAILLKKIEELTLYTIELKKEVDALKEKVK